MGLLGKGIPSGLSLLLRGVSHTHPNAWLASAVSSDQSDSPRVLLPTPPVMLQVPSGTECLDAMLSESNRFGREGSHDLGKRDDGRALCLLDVCVHV